MTQRTQTVTGESKASRVTELQEETLSDKSKVFNVQIESETIYCLSEKHAIQFMRELQEAIERATGIKG